MPKVIKSKAPDFTVINFKKIIQLSDADDKQKNTYNRCRLFVRGIDDSLTKKELEQVRDAIKSETALIIGHINSKIAEGKYKEAV